MEALIRHPDLPSATDLAGLDADALLLPALKHSTGLPGHRPTHRAAEGTSLLLIEPDAANRTMLATILCRLGYGVLAVSDEQTALAVYAAHAERISLLLFDYPPAEAQAAGSCAPAPSRRFLCLCRMPIDALPPGQMRLLPRPCTLEEILTALHELLACDGSAPGPRPAPRCPPVAS